MFRFGFLFAAAGMLLHGQAPSCQVEALAAGAMVEASISEADCRYLDAFPGSRTESRVKQYSLEVSERRVVTIELNSSEFDAMLYLFNAERRMLTLHNDIARDNTNSRIAANLAPGSYIVVAAARVPGTVGVFQLKTSAESPRSCQERSLEVGQRVEAVFEATSCRELDLFPTTPYSEILVSVYRIEVPRRGALTVTGDALNPLLTLANANDARQTFRGQRGRAIASVNAGPFLLYVRPAGPGTLALETRLEDLRPCQPRTLTAGEPVNATLADADCRMLDFFVPASDAAYLHVYILTVAEPTVLTVTMASAELDTFLEIGTAAGVSVASNDDASFDSTNSRIQVHLPRGEYRVLATTFDVETGTYSLQATAEAVRDCAPAPFILDTAVEGTIASDGCRVLDLVRFSTNSAPAKAYLLSVPERRVGRLDLNVPGARGAMHIIGENGAIALTRNTDTDGNAAIETTMPAGEYRLAIASPSTTPPSFTARGSLRVPPECPVTELALGAAVDGRIESTDCRVLDFSPFQIVNTRSKRYSFVLTQPSRVIMELSSAEIAPALLITNPEERLLGVFFEPAPATLRVTGTLPAGTYRLAATGALGGFGAFNLRVQAESTSATSAVPGTADSAPVLARDVDESSAGASFDSAAPLGWHGPKPPKQRLLQ
jgi:hypothetical protein